MLTIFYGTDASTAREAALYRVRDALAEDETAPARVDARCARAPVGRGRLARG